jgi:heptaprenyl diphosphate synthase
MKTSTFKITLTAILSALALITFLIESLFPPLFIPGARLGLANLFILIAIVFLGVKYAGIVFLIKIILGSILSGNLSSIMYSFPAGTISFVLQVVLIKYCSSYFSITAISALSAVVNNTVQNCIYVFVTSTTSLFIYLPYLVLLGLIAGFTVGLTTCLICKILPKKFLDTLSKGEINESQKR